MNYSYDRREAAAEDWKGLFSDTTSRVIAEAMKKWGENKLPEWGKDEFYRRGGAEVLVSHIVSQWDAGKLSDWLNSWLGPWWWHVSRSPYPSKLSYTGGTLKLTFYVAGSERVSDDVEGTKKRVETKLTKLGVKWKPDHSQEETWWWLNYHCEIKWKVPAETIVRKSLGLRVNNVGRDPRRVTWKGK